MLLHERLKGIREKKGYKQNYIAERIGVDKTTMSSYETGRREPSLEIVSKLSDIYEVTVDYLLGKSTDPRITAEQEKIVNEQVEKMMQILEEADEEDRIELETMMRVFLEMKQQQKKKER